MRGGTSRISGFLPVALLACALAAPAPGTAQPAAGPAAEDTLVLPLEEAVRIALRANPAYRRTANQLELNAPESRNVWANQVLPSLSLTLLDTGYRGNLTRRARDNFGNPIANPQSDWAYFSNTSQRLSLDWRIQGLNLLHAHREHEETTERRWIAEDAAAWTLRAEVRREYYEALEQVDLLAVEIAGAASRETDLEIARRLFGIAQVSRVDVLNAELGLRQQEIAIQRQRRAYEQALLELRSTLGDRDLPPFVPAGVPLPVFDPGALDEEALVSTALASAPDLAETRAALDVAEMGLDRAEDAWWPQLLLSYNLGRLAQDTDGAALFDVDHEPADLSSSFYVGLSFPLANDYFGTRLNEARARVSVADAHESLREAEIETTRRVRSGLIELRNAWETLALERRSREIAEEALELAREEYRLGASDFQALQDAVEAEADARRQVVEARYAFVDALVSLEEAVGAPVTPEGVAEPGLEPAPGGDERPEIDAVRGP